MLTKETDICKKVSAYHHYDVVHGVSKYWTCTSLCGLVIERRWIVRDDDEPISCKSCLRLLGRKRAWINNQVPSLPEQNKEVKDEFISTED